MLRKRKRKTPENADKETTPTKEADGQGATASEVTMQERPRICLIDVDNEIAGFLQLCGLNCYEGTFGPLVDIPNTSQYSSHHCLPNLDFPLNLHEYDIVIVDLQNPSKQQYSAEDHTPTETKGHEQVFFVSSFPETVFDPRPLSASILKSRLRPLMEKESILIVFTAAQEKVVYQPISVTANGPVPYNRSSYSLYDFYSDLPGWENITGKDTTVVSAKDATITSLLMKHNDDAIYTIAFDHPTHWKDNERVKSKNFLPLMEAGLDRIVAFACMREKNFAFFFPRIKKKQAFISDLLEKVLPGILPAIFPYSTQFAWLADHHYRLPNEDELISERERLEVEHKKRMEAIDLKIDANRQEHGYLHDLLTQSGQALVKTVEKFLGWLGFETVVNVDETNPDIQEEDLRIESDNGLLVIEVKGIGGTSTDAECSQISKVKYRRSKERKSFDVFALYCVNHQRFLPPESRQNPPFNTTQIQDAENDERGLITTYDLFKLYFNISRGFILKEDARKTLFQTGLVCFRPSGASAVLGKIEIHHKGLVVIIQAENMILRTGMKIILEDGGVYTSASIQELQVDGTTVAEATSGEVGIKLSAPVSKNTRIWIEKNPDDI